MRFIALHYYYSAIVQIIFYALLCFIQLQKKHALKRALVFNLCYSVIPTFFQRLIIFSIIFRSLHS